MEGWVKVHRKSLKSAVFQNPNLWKVWMWCLLKANSAEEYKIIFEGEEITLKPGEFITGRLEGARECKMKDSTFWDQLTKLKKWKNLDIKSDRKKSLLTIINWEVYQTGKEDSDIKSKNCPTTVRHKQEHKKDKNIYTSEKTGRNDRFACLTGRFAEFWSLYPKKVGKKKALQAFLRIKDIDNNITEIIKGLNSYIQSDQWLKDGGQYIPHPSTWLTQERWKDELPAQSAGMLMNINSFGRSGNGVGRIIQLNRNY